VALRARGTAGRVNLLGWSFVLGVAVLAEISVRSFDLRDSVATPSAALEALARELASGELSGELGTTLEAWYQGLAIAVVVGVSAGILIGSSRLLGAASFLVVEFLRPIPAVALIPLAVYFLGVDLPLRRAIVAYAAVWPILIATMYGVRGVDGLLVDVARTSGANRFGTLVRVTLPASLPSIWSGIRLSASIALLVAVTVEFVNQNDGIGAYMTRQENALHLPELYAAIVLVGLLGLVINVALRFVERRVLFWSGEERA
jgi:NitT/TauT family transport system permease protein